MSSSKQLQQACMQCTKRCLKVHGRKQSTSSTLELSFFKIMIGDFQEFLILPPKLAQSFQNLSNKYTYLEDSEGRRTKVRITIIGGSFAFQQGWRDFVLDHGIQIGELVVFKYTNDSFSVQIFAKSACERLHFDGTSNDNRHKREKNNIELPSNPVQIFAKSACERLHFDGTSNDNRHKREKNNIELPSNPVQIFAKSARERLHFDGTSNDNRHKREKNNIELPSNPMRVEKNRKSFKYSNRKSFKYSKDKQCATDDDHVKKDTLMEPIPELQIIEMTAAKSLVKKDIPIEPITELQRIEMTDIPIEPIPELQRIKMTAAKSHVKKDIPIEPIPDLHRIEMTEIPIEPIPELQRIEMTAAKSHVKKDVPKEPIPELHRIEMTAAKSFAEGVEEGLAIFDSLELPIAPPMRYSGEPCNMNNGDAVEIEQHGKVSLIDLCSYADMETDLPNKDKSVCSVDSTRGLKIKCLEECGADQKACLAASDTLTGKYPHTKDQTVSLVGHLKSVSSVSEQKGTDRPPFNSRDSITMEIPCYPEDTNTLLVCEDKLLQQHNYLERPQSEPEAGCDDYGTINQSETNMAIDHYPHTVRRLSTVDCSEGEQNMYASNFSDHQMIDTEPDDENFHIRSSSCTGVEHGTDKEEIVFASNGAHHEETCCSMDEDLTGKFEANKDAPVSLCQESKGSACPSYEAVMPRNKSYVFEDSLKVKGNMMPSSERVKGTQLKEQLGGVPDSESGLVGNDTLSIPDPSELPKDPERNSFVTGIMPQNSTCVNCAADNGETLLPSTRLVDEFPMNEDGKYCNMDEDLMDTFEVDEGAPIGMCLTERDDVIKNCTEDVIGTVMPSPETIHDSHSKEQSGDVSSPGFGLVDATRVDVVGSDTLPTGIIPVDSPKMNCSADPKRIQFASNGIDNEFLTNEDETCYNMDEDSTGQCEVDRGAPAGMYPIKNEDNALIARNKSYVSKDSIEVLSGAATTNCSKDKEGNVKPSSDLVVDTRMEENYGTMPEDSCLQEKPSGVIKIESMDSGDSPLPNNGKFAFSVTINAQTWIESPKILPTCRRKWKGDRRVVMLRDPEMRVWPILYHESTRFVGFIGGWKEFITANSLHKGDVCHFEHTEGQETTYQMLSSKA